MDITRRRSMAITGNNYGSGYSMLQLWDSKLQLMVKSKQWTSTINAIGNHGNIHKYETPLETIGQ
jgi:hypothetical protein